MRWIILIIILVLIGIAAFLYFKNMDNKILVNENLPVVTAEELEQGWYYGEQNAKRPGTPDTWQYELSGTRSARWYDPAKIQTN